MLADGAGGSRGYRFGSVKQADFIMNRSIVHYAACRGHLYLISNNALTLYFNPCSLIRLSVSSDLGIRFLAQKKPALGGFF